MKGGSCFPLSPMGDLETFDSNDQLAKILEKIEVNPEEDFSFITNEVEYKHLNKVRNQV